MIGSLNLVQGHPTGLSCETKNIVASPTRAAWSAQSIGVLSKINHSHRLGCTRKLTTSVLLWGLFDDERLKQRIQGSYCSDHLPKGQVISISRNSM